MTLHEQLAQAIAKRRAVAVAASQDGWRSTPTGEHWEWVCNECDTPVPITDVVLLDAYLNCPNLDRCGGSVGSLRSVEHYRRADAPQDSLYDLPHFVLNADEIAPTVGLHITLNDPAFVIRQCERDIKILARHSIDCCGPDGARCYEVAEMAIVYEIGVEP